LPTAVRPERTLTATRADARGGWWRRMGSFVTSAEDNFEALFSANYGDVLAYALRR